jgi:predicted membrane protein
MKKTRGIIWGIAILALGVIFGGNALGIWNVDIFFKGWWTLFIIVPSVVSIFTEKDKLASVGFLSAGIIFLLAAQGVITYDMAWKIILPVFLVLIGLGIILRTIFHSDNDKEVEQKVKEAGDGKNLDSQMAIFSGSERTYKDEAFTGSNLVAVFGGAELDLTHAKFTKDTVIKAFALFGGIDIRVPEDVIIKSRSGFVFGGISDDRKSDQEKGNHTIYLDAAGGFGGITISDKPKKK